MKLKQTLLSFLILFLNLACNGDKDKGGDSSFVSDDITWEFKGIYMFDKQLNTEQDVKEDIEEGYSHSFLIVNKDNYVIKINGVKKGSSISMENSLKLNLKNLKFNKKTVSFDGNYTNIYLTEVTPEALSGSDSILEISGNSSGKLKTERLKFNFVK